LRRKLALVIVGVAAATRDLERLVAHHRCRGSPDLLGLVTGGARCLGVLTGQREAAVLIMIERQVGERGGRMALAAGVARRAVGELAAVNVLVTAQAGRR